MSVVYSCKWTPPIIHPKRFALWSCDVRNLLEYLPRYVAAGRKERVFLVPLEGPLEHRLTLDRVEASSESHQVQILILPDQEEAYQQVQQQNVEKRQWLFLGEERGEDLIPIRGADEKGDPILTETEVTFTVGDEEGYSFFSLGLEECGP